MSKQPPIHLPDIDPSREIPRIAEAATHAPAESQPIQLPTFDPDQKISQIAGTDPNAAFDFYPRIVPSEAPKTEAKPARRRGRIASAAMGLATIISQLQTPEAHATGEVTRIAGRDRIETAIEISNALFPTDSIDGAIIASANNYPDAIVAASKASLDGVPILLNAKDQIDGRTFNEVARLDNPDRLLAWTEFLGGTAAISDNVIRQYAENGRDPDQMNRLAGPTRHETAVKIAETFGASNTPTQVFVASSRNGNFGDPSVAGSVAGLSLRPGASPDRQRRSPVVTTEGSTLPAVTRQFLEKNTAAEIIAIGNEAAAAVPWADKKITAPDLPTLSVKVAEAYPAYKSATSDRPDGKGKHIIAIASSENWPDGLAGGVFTSFFEDGNLLLNPKDHLHPAIAEFIRNNPDVTIVILGGTAAISDNVVREINAIRNS